MTIIAAVAENGVIGGNNNLLWHISADLKRFKKLTTGHTIVMGNNTFQSLPVRPLPQRTNIVMTRNKDLTTDSCIMVHSVEEALEKMDPEGENFVIGGGNIYTEFFPLAQKLYITKVREFFTGDTFFPEISLDEWELVESLQVDDDPQNDFSYSFETYLRK
ncbi:MAG: dihydrofolate reductase [Bacteroidales bacterium]|nr:dihydrofolate reductase [Bacteroidales bacterium]